MYELIQDSAEFLAQKSKLRPKIAITLGSGLGTLIKQIDIDAEIPYSEIPHFPISTVKGHRGSLIFGTINHIEVAVFSGRFHYYEGYQIQQIAFPIRVMRQLGIEKWILSNAAGGVNTSFKVGDLMVINDHINMMGANPLIGENDDRIGPRFPEMSEAYNLSMQKIAFQCAEQQGLHLQKGVYVGLAGPNLETQAEYRMFHLLGADAVGMSTVPETIAACHCGIKVFAVSVISNIGLKGRDEKDSHEKVLEAAAKAEPKLTKLIYEMLPQL